MLKIPLDNVDDARIQQEQSERYVRAQQLKMERRNRVVQTGISDDRGTCFLFAIGLFLAEMRSKGKIEETCRLDVPDARYNVARMLAIKYLGKHKLTVSSERVNTMATSMLHDNDHKVQARGPEQQRCSSPFSFEELNEIARQQLQEKEELKQAAHQPLQEKKAEAGGHSFRVLKSPPPMLSPKSAVAARRQHVLQFLHANDPKKRWSPVALKRKINNSNQSSAMLCSGGIRRSPVVVLDQRLEDDQQKQNVGMFNFDL